ncbi:uncharacterized protein LOC133867609 isoform X1 [Alnus glutinosa]|uniref:uncharacterized protein LOC133867609 isoform X1 n=1 Tax=Alnus glutinosa TaxID=3517 RepID=UPI002D77292A|nr:uncharacterized protein LOC133867609 isoform X1 [Alnus glutinosa]XP_062160344.1 uncharacterized protein LOC133867609 isoform X1 [Alnus glutinosa]
MATSRKTVLAIKSYQNQAQVLVKNYLLADRFIPYTSILGGMFLCKVAYDLTQLISTFYFKSYNGLTKIQRIEWNNRGISTLHAIFITVVSLYFVFWSDLFSDQQLSGIVTFRSSPLSVFALGILVVLYFQNAFQSGFFHCHSQGVGCQHQQALHQHPNPRGHHRLVALHLDVSPPQSWVSVGYFLADLGMIFWLYPSLGGMEYVIHHSLSGVAVAYSMFSGEGQLYTFMILISEVTTPEVNMRWYLDTAGMKRSCAYLINGVLIFFAWLAARILLFVYMFYHVYLHYDQVIQMQTFGYFLVFVVPSALAIMNLMWFGKIIKGLKKTIAKRQ